MSPRFTAAQALVALAIAAFLLVFLMLPVLNVIHIAVTEPDGAPTLEHFRSFFSLTLMRESFWNSLYVALMTVLCASVIAVPLAYLTVRFQFRGAALIQTLGVLPLVMPAFVGAAAMQLLFGRSGSVNLLLTDWFDISLPLMQGLNGVIFVEALHYFPFILLNLAASLANVDVAMEEAAQNLGASRGRTIVRVVVPLMMGGLLAGFVTSFITAAGEISETILLTSRESLAPMSYGIYLYMQSIAGRGPGAALGVLAVVLVAFGTYLSHRFVASRHAATERRT